MPPTLIVRDEPARWDCDSKLSPFCCFTGGGFQSVLRLEYLAHLLWLVVSLRLATREFPK